MKRLIYQVYVGKRSRLYDHCTESVKNYCKEHGIGHVVQRTPALFIKPNVFRTNRSRESYEKYGGYLPIYEKENAFAYFKDYDQIAIIDADVYIRPGAPNFFEELTMTHTNSYDFGGVIEKDMPVTEEYQAKLKNYSYMQYGKLPTFKDTQWGTEAAPFMNMGVMLMNNSFADYLEGQTPLQFISRDEFQPFVDGLGAWKWSTDQTLLNYWIPKVGMKVKNLDWKWNGLYGVNTRIKECHFVHFFLKDLLPQQGENVDELMEKIGG